ncbi:PEP-CTERM sorting domain-containing protein [Paludibaculum fermentans]|uniref:PEP-CTERM sorting domain-containing protein n=1 Tax=Paludibaculum fermentans TaxID=1473598 RepID=UPI003EBF5D8B
MTTQNRPAYLMNRLASRALLTAFVLVASFAATASAAILTIQPIKICDDGGLNCANDTEQTFLAETNKIWAQAGITFSYLPFTTTNSTTFLSLDDQGEVTSLFATAPGAAVNPLVISMWFVANHFDAYGEVNTIGGNKIVIDSVIFGVNRLDTIAHEVGHLLGLLHNDPGVDMDFLMRSGSDRLTPSVIGDITPDGAGLDKLTTAQIQTALADPKISAVPEPATAALVLFGLGGLALARRRNQSRA